MLLTAYRKLLLPLLQARVIQKMTLEQGKLSIIGLMSCIGIFLGHGHTLSKIEYLHVMCIFPPSG